MKENFEATERGVKRSLETQFNGKRLLRYLINVNFLTGDPSGSLMGNVDAA